MIHSFKKMAAVAALGFAAAGTSSYAAEEAARQKAPCFDVTAPTKDGEPVSAYFMLLPVPGVSFSIPSNAGDVLHDVFAGVVKKYTRTQFEDNDPNFINDIVTRTRATSKMMGVLIAGEPGGPGKGCKFE